jgi:negative regulator of flagellin synthesis FlgM
VKINNSSESLPLASTSGKKARAPVAQSADSSSPATDSSASSDTSVSLGATTQLLGIGGSNASTPPVNAAKVAEIKQAISEGRFQVNSGAVADSLVKSVTDLISAHNT